MMMVDRTVIQDVHESLDPSVSQTCPASIHSTAFPRAWMMIAQPRRAAVLIAARRAALAVAKRPIVEVVRRGMRPSTATCQLDASSVR